MASLSLKCTQRSIPLRGGSSPSFRSSLVRAQRRAAPGRFSSSVPGQNAPNNSLLRGLVAGAGLTLATGLVAYRTGVISVGGDTAQTSASTSSSKYGSHDDIQKAIAELREALSDKSVSTDINALKSFGSSANSYHPTSPHSVVVHVTSTDDVVKVVNVARKYRIPVVAYSGATSLEGHYSGVNLCSFSISLIVILTAIV